MIVIHAVLMLIASIILEVILGAIRVLNLLITKTASMSMNVDVNEFLAHIAAMEMHFVQISKVVSTAIVILDLLVTGTTATMLMNVQM